MLQPDVNKGSLDAGEDPGNLTKINIADGTAVFRIVYKEVDQVPIFCDGYPCLGCRRVDYYFFQHNSYIHRTRGGYGFESLSRKSRADALQRSGSIITPLERSSAERHSLALAY